jgi:hypothetical protein
MQACVLFVSRDSRGPVAHSALCGMIPSVLSNIREAPLVSVAHFKDTMHLFAMNLFVLIPDTLRVRRHGTEDMGLMRSMVDLAMQRRDSGAYRSRWSST